MADFESRIFDLTDDSEEVFVPIVKVIGVGGAGGNAVENLIKCSLEGADLYVANTDLQALSISSCKKRIQLGKVTTSGLGAGAMPNIGRDAAEESYEQIAAALSGAHVVFIAAGMGGGTGTGAAPVVAKIAKELGAISVAIVTTPFNFEGSERLRLAEEGVRELEKYVHTAMIVSNQGLLRVAGPSTKLTDAFADADEVLKSSVKSMSDLLWKPGLVNLDLADMRAILSNGGVSVIGSGEAIGEDRAKKAFLSAISNPLLEGVDIAMAKGILLGVSGGCDMTLFEVEEIASAAQELVNGDDKKFIFGTTIDEELNGKIRVSIVATGVRKDDQANTSKLFTNRPTIKEALVSVVDDFSDSDDDVDEAQNVPTLVDRLLAQAEVEMVAQEREKNSNGENWQDETESQFSTQFSKEEGNFEDERTAPVPTFIDSSILDMMVTEARPRVEFSFIDPEPVITKKSPRFFDEKQSKIDGTLDFPNEQQVVNGAQLAQDHVDDFSHDLHSINQSRQVAQKRPNVVIIDSPELDEGIITEEEKPNESIPSSGFWGAVKSALHRYQQAYQQESIDGEKKN